MASTLTWEWRAPSGEPIMATLELPSRVESVWLGPHLVGRSLPGGTPGGYALRVAAGEGRVEFNAPLRACAFLLNGAVVPPVRVATKSNHTVLIVVAAVAMAVLFFGVLGGLAALGVQKRIAKDKADLEAPLTQKYPSENGLIVAHYPADFAAASRSEASLQVSRGAHDDSILLVATGTPVSDDPAELSRVALKPILEAFGKKGSVATATEGPATCLGSPGYSTTGSASLTLEKVDTWSCTFVKEGRGYVFFISVNKTYAEDMPLLKRIVEATELTGGAEAAEDRAAPEPAPAPSAPPVRGGVVGGRSSPKKKPK